ncbi:Glycosyl hydrolase family 99 [Tenacibaculum sp. MAR_2009_124]|uniref:glycoside hydrolase family 71/99-like protein n=1 Tax=Tenacibaculum sp. MAR_2009_124 TaxID=1250059 RepID=UPI00089499DF|nr:glycoside hydrolase family 71/99-like protein [Tenacibaculum sp. MAR_2009_124]SEC20474.1 Glycosyl hydrolase family 99 [Tenacibaculum sp. MAR_2009_124]
MKSISNRLILLMLLCIAVSCSEDVTTEQIDQEVDIEDIENLYKELLEAPDENTIGDMVKRNPKKLYVHYMPWFHTKEYDGYWGQHWTMTNKNPDNYNELGNREIGSHYYPLVGPYSSQDPDLQKYHLLLMKLAGIDGVIFDWYGSRDINDYLSIKKNTESFIEEIEEVGLEFAIMYEDRVAEYTMAKVSDAKRRTAAGMEAVANDIKYIEDTYFTSENYIRHNGAEMLFVFGPHFMVSSEQWNEVFSNIGSQPEVFTLWKASDRVGKMSGGEFSWVDKDHMETLKGYYNYARENEVTTIGGVYPGFHDFYVEGGWRESNENDWMIPHNNGETLSETLSLMDNEPVEFIQLITWNDFGEGTMLEPTEEFGFNYLKELQAYTKVSYTEETLELPYQYYKLKKKYRSHRRLNRVLNGVYKFIFKSKTKKASKLLKRIQKRFTI